MPVVSVSSERLASLNEESQACIKRWGIEFASSDSLGRYLLSRTGVPAGELVLVLPPNLIQAFAEVTNYNAVIQARSPESSFWPALHDATPRILVLWATLVAALLLAEAAHQVRFSEHQAERLYSASLTPDDLDNFLSHSCEPLCELGVDHEYTVRVTTKRPIAPLEPISIDYERTQLLCAGLSCASLHNRAELEEDMIAQGVDFDCACGTGACRGRIVGTSRRKDMKA
jgi:hypothetical protein